MDRQVSGWIQCLRYGPQWLGQSVMLDEGNARLPQGLLDCHAV